MPVDKFKKVYILGRKVTAGPQMHQLLLEHQACVLLAEELTCSHINSFLPVAKLALPSASPHAKASLLIILAPEGAATASKREGILPPPLTLVNTKLQEEEVLSLTFSCIHTCVRTHTLPFSLLPTYL